MASRESNKLPRANREIISKQVRLIDDSGEMQGVVDIEEAIKMAEKKGLDLVEIAPGASPPVCKMLDFGKYKFELRRKHSQNKKKQKTVQVKEIKLRPTIDIHDYNVKLKSINKFISGGDKVKVSLRFRGREIAHKEVGLEIFNRIKEDTAEIAKVELEPRMDGRQIMMVITPK